LSVAVATRRRPAAGRPPGPWRRAGRLGGALGGRELGLRAPFLLTAVALPGLLAAAARLVTAARVEAAAVR
jgi:hypothetical protein